LGQRKNGEAIVGALVFLLVCVASWLACHWFAGRAAFLLVGAMLATSMSASVFFWIIPGQKKVIAAIQAGQAVDPVHGQRGKQRSVHNTYFTLPVLFAMLSGHYSFTYNHPQNWLVLILMMFAGAAIRQFFVMRHGFKLGHFAPSQDQVHAALGQRNGTGSANASTGTGDQGALAAHGVEVIEHGALHRRGRACPWAAR
jgi:uncharacterized membrane protein